VAVGEVADGEAVRDAARGRGENRKSSVTVGGFCPLVTSGHPSSAQEYLALARVGPQGRETCLLK
jgi:hypothetical protein